VPFLAERVKADFARNLAKSGRPIGFFASSAGQLLEAKDVVQSLAL